MPKFSYTAIDAGGQQVSDVITAPSRAGAIEELSSLNLCPVTIEEKKDDRSKSLSRPGKVSKADVEAFTRELSNLLAAGVPLSKGLNILCREASKASTKQQWTSIRDHVSGGMSLADSLSRWPKSFPPVYLAMVRAGETGGFLDLVLGQIADFRSREQELLGKVRAATVYPIVLAVMAAGILAFLMTYFIPRFSSIFEEFGESLPKLTLAIVTASDVITKYWLIIIIGIILIIILIKRSLSSEQGRVAAEKILLRTPMLGKGIARFALVRFCRMLGTLVGAGVPLVTALHVAKEAIGNQTLANAVSGAIEKVQRGTSLARSLGDCPQLFGPSVVEMVSVAEESGRLDEELVRLASVYEDELDRHLKMMVALAEPALLLIMAVLVGTVVMGMMLPIFNLQEIIR
jgi:type II secretory pathway component PulF